MREENDLEKEISIIKDWRDIRGGNRIPSENYVDQPCFVTTEDGNWLCVLTTGYSTEGQAGMHVVSTISCDKGKTWSELVDIEPACDAPSSYVMPILAANGRVYAIYTYNEEKIHIGEHGLRRNDSLGSFFFRYSDDNGQSWSDKRYRIPMRVTAVDRRNPWEGVVQMFWGSSKPIVTGGSVYISFTKFSDPLFTDLEGWFLRSDNLLTAADPDTIRWQLLPDGDDGLYVSEHGDVHSEQNLVSLANGDLYCMYRTNRGYPMHAYSRDGAHTWTKPVPATYEPNGTRIFKNPRACPRIWKTSNGKFLFWFHNNNGPKEWEHRNPAWISGGVERDGHVYWSEPEILLYHPNPAVKSRAIESDWSGMSYPDLIEEDGRYWVAQTEKQYASLHEIPRELLEGVWSQGETRQVVDHGLLVSLKANSLNDTEVDNPQLPNLVRGGGFTIELLLTLNSLDTGQIILDSRTENGNGICITTTGAGTIELEMSDGCQCDSWDCDTGLLHVGDAIHVVFIVDGGSKIVSVVVNGRLCDGGQARSFGWKRFDLKIGDVTGGSILRISEMQQINLQALRIYNRYLTTSEAVGNYRATKEN